MRFAFVTATPQSIEAGSGTFVAIQNLAGALQELGHEVVLVAPPWRRLPRVYWLRRYGFNRRVAEHPPRADATIGFDLDGFLLAGRVRPFIAYIHGQLADEARFERGVTRRSMMLQAAWERRSAGRADQVLALSDYLRQRIADEYAVPLERIAVVPPAFDGPSWTERCAAAAPPRDPAGVQQILTVGRLYPRKNVPALVEAVARLTARGHALSLLIVGDGPERRAVERTIARHRVGDVVQWRRYVAPAQLPAIYAGADLFCLPSLQEGFGIVLLEAMAAGLPIVACRAGAVPETVRHGVNGVLAAAGDGAALADGLERLLRDHGLCARMRRVNRATAAGYTIARAAHRFLNAAGKVIDPPRRPPPTGPAEPQ